MTLIPSELNHLSLAATVSQSHKFGTSFSQSIISPGVDSVSPFLFDPLPHLMSPVVTGAKHRVMDQTASSFSQKKTCKTCGVCRDSSQGPLGYSQHSLMTVLITFSDTILLLCHSPRLGGCSPLGDVTHSISGLRGLKLCSNSSLGMGRKGRCFSCLCLSSAFLYLGTFVCTSHMPLHDLQTRTLSFFLWV